MDTNPAPTTATAPGLPAEAQERGRGRYGWLGGWRMLAAAAVVAAAALAVPAFGGVGATERMLPLLFTLPCALMMLMCMRHADGPRREPGGSGADTNATAGDR